MRDARRKVSPVAAAGPSTVDDTDLAPDGRFLMMKPVGRDDDAAPQTTVVLNWFEEFNERVPIP